VKTSRRLTTGLCLAIAFAFACTNRFDVPKRKDFPPMDNLKWQQANYCLQGAEDQWRAARRYYALDLSLGIGAAAAAGTGSVLLAGSTIYCEGDCKSKIAGVMLTAAAAALLSLREVADWGAAASMRAEAAESARYYGIMHIDGYVWDEEDTGFDLCTEVLEQIAKNFAPTARREKDEDSDAGANNGDDAPDAGVAPASDAGS